jgi:hypothetical protein
VSDAYATIIERLRAACPSCLGTTVTFDERGPTICAPCAQAERPLPLQVRRFADRVWLRLNKDLELDRAVINVGRVLTHGDTNNPVSGLMLREWLSLSERQVKSAVETLRAEWTLPAISRRKRPAGYWFAGSAEEYLAWWRTHRAQAITELTTGYRNLKANYSDLAGQGHLDFITSVSDELKEALR